MVKTVTRSNTIWETSIYYRDMIKRKIESKYCCGHCMNSFYVLFWTEKVYNMLLELEKKKDIFVLSLHSGILLYRWDIYNIYPSIYLFSNNRRMKTEEEGKRSIALICEHISIKFPAAAIVQVVVWNKRTSFIDVGRTGGDHCNKERQSCSWSVPSITTLVDYRTAHGRWQTTVTRQ